MHFKDAIYARIPIDCRFSIDRGAGSNTSPVMTVQYKDPLASGRAPRTWFATQTTSISTTSCTQTATSTSCTATAKSACGTDASGLSTYFGSPPDNDNKNNDANYIGGISALGAIVGLTAIISLILWYHRKIRNHNATHSSTILPARQTVAPAMAETPASSMSPMSNTAMVNHNSEKPATSIADTTTRSSFPVQELSPEAGVDSRPNSELGGRASSQAPNPNTTAHIRYGW